LAYYGLSLLAPATPLRDFWDSLLSTFFAQGKIASPQAKISYRGISLKPLPKTYREGVIVVGDAAGQSKELRIGYWACRFYERLNGSQLMATSSCSLIVSFLLTIQGLVVVDNVLGLGGGDDVPIFL
jgi:hypothetical protein